LSFQLNILQSVSLQFLIMKHLLKPFAKWFGYTRRERRSSFLLLIIIFLVIAIRYVIPERRIVIEDISSSLTSSGTSSLSSTQGEDHALFYFDPDTCTAETLVSLGLSARQAATMVKYRSSGGSFRQPSDILKIYGIDSSLGKRLMPYMAIKGRNNKSYRNNQHGRLIDLNKCDSADLERLPALGPVLSSRIIKYRNLLGGYYSVDQLREVYGLSDSTLKIVSGLLTADTAGLKQININKAGYGELLRHPYIDRYDVQSILKYRKLRGTIGSAAELARENIMNEQKLLKIEPYLDFR
jgi:DNA uptake protein ComE-like DNA-binding protein